MVVWVSQYTDLHENSCQFSQSKCQVYVNFKMNIKFPGTNDCIVISCDDYFSTNEVALIHIGKWSSVAPFTNMV